MRRWGYGLVIGKFRPPHTGHGLLIRTALAQCDRVTVLVCADDTDTIPAELRAEWLREIHPAADVRVVETTGYDDEDSELWADLTRAWLGRAPDAVFTSEDYGDAYARLMGAVHVCVDRARQQIPISATRILRHPLANRAYLEPPVRAHFVLRVALVGAESTGKTTLARALAHRYQTVWVPEYGRTYWEGLLTLPEIDSATSDFVHIAESQQRMEDQLARHANRVLICDTDALTTWLWHERYLGSDATRVRALADARRYALHLLLGDEIPWCDDGTRTRALERPWLQQRIAEELDARGAHVIKVEGPLEVRIETAAGAIDALLTDGGRPAPSATMR